MGSVEGTINKLISEFSRKEGASDRTESGGKAEFKHSKFKIKEMVPQSKRDEKENKPTEEHDDSKSISASKKASQDFFHNLADVEKRQNSDDSKYLEKGDLYRDQTDGTTYGSVKGSVSSAKVTDDELALIITLLISKRLITGVDYAHAGSLSATSIDPRIHPCIRLPSCPSVHP